MGKPKASSIDVPDPLAIIEAEKNANRTDSVTPFGQTVWQGDQQVTSFSPQMQAIQDRMFGVANQGYDRIEPPSYVNDILGGIAGRVGERYGVTGMDTSKPQQSAQPPPMQLPPGMGFDNPAPLPQEAQSPYQPDPTQPGSGGAHTPGFSGGDQRRRYMSQLFNANNGTY